MVSRSELVLAQVMQVCWAGFGSLKLLLRRISGTYGAHDGCLPVELSQSQYRFPSCSHVGGPPA